LAVIQEQMKFFKEEGMSIDAYIRGGDLSFVSHKITQIFKILFPNLIEEPCVYSRGKGDYRILTTPKELLNSLEIYNPQTNKIVHFTSLFKLKKILETNTFRLYNAHNSNYKTEFANWLDDFDIDADKLKQKTYIGSFCDSKILDDNEKASVMWNEYGEQGKGVVIKFEIAKDLNTKIFEDNFMGEVTDVFLGKVSYKPIDKQRLKRFESEFQDYQENYKFYTNVLDYIYPFAYMTKKPKFEFENELRLFKANHWFNEKHTEMVACDKHDDDCDCEVKYYKVPLFKKEEGKVELVISEIQFGPNLSDYDYEKQKNEIENIFRETKINGDYPIPFFSRSTISETSYNEAIERHKQKSQIKETATSC